MKSLSRSYIWWPILRQLFATHGIPDVIVPDNGSSFTSVEFSKFSENNLINHIFSAPFHPSSNGQVERMVRTTKEYLKKIPNGEIRLRLARFLLDQHVTPHSSTGRSTAELLFNQFLFKKLVQNKMIYRSLTFTKKENLYGFETMPMDHDGYQVRFLKSRGRHQSL